MSDFIDFYEVLGIARSATGEEIKSAWKKLVCEWHPDTVTDVAKKAAYDQKCALINQAKNTLLRDRARYDEKLQYHAQAGEREAGEREAAERAANAERARRASAAWAEQARQAEAARAERERREAADRAARAKAARKKLIRKRVLRVAIAAWAIVYLALTPKLVTTNLPFGWSDSPDNTFFTIAAVLVLAVALPMFGALTKVFEFEIPSKRFGMAIGIVAGQGVTVFVLLVLAPLI
ncbi:MAG: J domain-containing protein, partial [Actinomycetota bacterium]